ncbi:MAG: hypothetical protein K8R90_04810 [Candidatus Cloacimonetes bacterium]|nr:hypothetical protein [Candidatus Cloacimonadota bacterium]
MVAHSILIVDEDSDNLNGAERGLRFQRVCHIELRLDSRGRTAMPGIIHP